METQTTVELVEKMLAGDPRALARLISQVERGDVEVPEIMQRIYPALGRAYCVGITGPPGAGKSTLTDKLTELARREGKTVGIIAVDPTSPFSGGALLGDRVRMQQHFLDAGVFIRSMATRGSHGGLPQTARGVIKLLDAAGRDLIFVETVGVGQTELDIVETADTVVVVLVPEAGDAVQTMKAGLMEIADIFVVNKADREGAERLQRELRLLVDMHAQRNGWRIPVLATEAPKGVGVEALYAAIAAHRQALQESGQLAARRRAHRRKELLDLLQHRLLAALVAQLEKDRVLLALVEQVQEGVLDPYSAAQQILKDREALWHSPNS
ncbi:MAG: methylmalonyl Co-A mutase-associated GTPase MeaB [Candidatus Tectimicrobiota bacterium]|nr:MAG: methylmalonyl Co-A mutase-associated GTPase MeaB [Candidatus Tectomicrobia bacterium]